MKVFCAEKDGIIISNGMSVSKLMQKITDFEEQENSFYIFEVQDVVQKYQTWREKLPRVKPFYAVKCNDHPFVLSVLKSLGTGFDCASKQEIQKILDLGVDPSRIVFAHPAKLPSHIRYARENGIPWTTFDNAIELHKIKNLYPDVKLVLRIRSDATVAQFVLGNKFGCRVADEAPALLYLARKLNLDVVGICFHVGSGCGEPEAYGRAIRATHQLFLLGNKIGFHMNLLDIGGGFKGDKNSPIDEIARIINTALDEYFPISRGVSIISEPGTYFVASSFTIAVNVISKRTIDDPYNTGSLYNMFYVNDSTYTSFDISLHNPELLKPIVLKKQNSRKMIRSTIWGAACSESDRICINVDLPADLEVGDWLSFENMGAYSTSIARTFCRMPSSKIYTLVRKSNRNMLESAIVRGGNFQIDTMSLESSSKEKPEGEKWKRKQTAVLSYLYKKASYWCMNKWHLA